MSLPLSDGQHGLVSVSLREENSGLFWSTKFDVTRVGHGRGFEIDLSWKNGSLERVRVLSLLGNPLRLRRGENVRALARTSRGATIEFTGDQIRPASN
jgi:hypothetical protein